MNSAPDGTLYLSILSRSPDLLTDVGEIALEIGDEAQLLAISDDGTDIVELEPYTMTQAVNFQRAILAVPTEVRQDVYESLENLGATRPATGPPYIEVGPQPSASQSVFLIDLTYAEW